MAGEEVLGGAGVAVDTVVVYSDIRAVESRIVRSELFASRFEPVANLPVGTRGASYTVYRRRPPADATTP